MALYSIIILALVEGLTEFIPVSSTGHLILIGHFLPQLGLTNPSFSFKIMIQLGAIMAIITVYFGRLLNILATLPTSAETRRFAFGIVIAFLPAAVIGALAHGFIKTVLAESPALVCTTLILGGVALWLIDRIALNPKHTDAFAYPPSLALKIGFCQCLAMIPGVSRSGATIGGALLLGTDKRSAAEFSFFLALPTMAGAFAYELYKSRNELSVDDLTGIGIGFVIAFVSAAFVVRFLLDFVSKHGFAPFAYWRILVGTLGLIGLSLGL